MRGRKLLFVIAAVGIAASCGASGGQSSTSTTRAPSDDATRVFMRPALFNGSLDTCVFSHVDEGVAPEKALSECVTSPMEIGLNDWGRGAVAQLEADAQARSPLAVLGNPPGQGISCSARGPINPLVAAPENPQDPNYTSYWEAEQEKWAQAVQDSPEGQALDINDEASWKRLMQTEAWQKKEDADAHLRRKAFACCKTAPELRAECNGLAEQIERCNAEGWKSDRCKLVYSQLHGCDPTRELVTPDGPPRCGEEQTVDPERVAQVIFVACSSHIRPAPGEDPCKQAPVKFKAFIVPLSDKKGTVCGNTKALTTDEQCVPSVDIIEATLGQFAALHEWFAKHHFTAVVPLVGPPPPGPK